MGWGLGKDNSLAAVWYTRYQGEGVRGGGRGVRARGGGGLMLVIVMDTLPDIVHFKGGAADGDGDDASGRGWA